MLSGVKGNNVGEYLKGATEAGATHAKEAIQINDSNKVVYSLNLSPTYSSMEFNLV